ncbi:MAG: TonB-dependent siderophore receptor, partial [Cyanobacteria bacterium P01_D01_bin.6]
RTDSLTVGYDFTHEFSDSWRLAHGFRYVSQDYDALATLPIGFDGITGNITAIYADRLYRSDDYEVQTSVVGEFNTGSIEHTLLAGFDMRFNRFDEAFTRIDFANPFILNLFNPVEGPPRPDLSNLTSFPGAVNTATDQYGIFLQDQITFSEQFILVGSLRYDTASTRNFTTPANNRNDGSWSPRIGLVYQPIETVALYANYSQSFEPNTGTSATGETFEPEQGEGFEVGVKAELLGGNLLVTLAYFDITKQNVLTADPNNFGSSVVTGEQNSQGIELDIVGEILPGWNIIANYAYTDARITEDNTNPVGNRLPNAPRHSAGLWTTYQIQQGDLQGLGFGLGFDYVGDREGDLANSFEPDGYFLTNAALFYEQENWRFGLNINNLFDVNYISSTSARNLGNAPGTPLSLVGSVSVQF